MNVSSLLIVMMSRTFGILCSVTGSAVSSPAAIAGSAEFFAPLMLTVPCSGFPPRILNLSISKFAETRGSAILLKLSANSRVIPARFCGLVLRVLRVST
jgi:hypothetical protein